MNQEGRIGISTPWNQLSPGNKLLPETNVNLQWIITKIKTPSGQSSKFEIFFIILWKYRKFLTHWYIFCLEKIITWLRKSIFKNKNFRFWYPYKIFLRMIFWNFFFSSCSSDLEDSCALKKIQNIIRYVVVITITKSTVFLIFVFN